MRPFLQYAHLLPSCYHQVENLIAFALFFQLDKPQFKYKSFYYLNGLTEGTETIVLFIAFCIWPQHFVVLASIFAAACAVTIMTRIYGGYHTLKRLETDIHKPIKEVNNGE